MTRLADAHVHFFANGYRSRYGTLFPQGREIALYRRFRNEHRIGEVLAVGYEGSGYRGNNRYLATLAAVHRWLKPLAFCLPDQPPTPRKMADWWKNRFVGISLYPQNREGVEQLAAWPAAVFNTLNARRAIISINLPWKTLGSLVPFCERLPDCRVLLSHLGLPGPVEETTTERLIKGFRSFFPMPHVAVKASGFYAAERIAHAYPHHSAKPLLFALAEGLGAERLCWGSDFSPALAEVSFIQTIGAVRDAGFPLSQAEAILGGNLRGMLARISPLSP